MKKNWIIGVIALILALAMIQFTSAETIILKSGQKIEADIIQRADGYIEVDISGVNVPYFFEEIKSIDGEAVAAPERSDSHVITYEEIAQNMEEESQAHLRDNPQSARSYIERGIALRMNGNQEEAIKYFTKAIEIDPGSTQAYHNRGLSYAGSEINRPDLAMADFTKAIEIDPDDGDLYFLRASLYFQQQDYDLAWEDINKAKALGLKYYVRPFPQFLQELKRVSGREG